MKKMDTVKPSICGKLVRTYDNSNLPCIRPQGHEGGCNPFSDNAPQTEQKTYPSEISGGPLRYKK